MASSSCTLFSLLARSKIPQHMEEAIVDAFDLVLDLFVHRYSSLLKDEKKLERKMVRKPTVVSHILVKMSKMLLSQNPLHFFLVVSFETTSSHKFLKSPSGPYRIFFV